MWSIIINLALASANHSEPQCPAIHLRFYNKFLDGNVNPVLYWDEYGLEYVCDPEQQARFEEVIKVHRGMYDVILALMMPKDPETAKWLNESNANMVKGSKKVISSWANGAKKYAKKYAEEAKSVDYVEPEKEAKSVDYVKPAEERFSSMWFGMTIDELSKTKLRSVYDNFDWLIQEEKTYYKTYLPMDRLWFNMIGRTKFLYFLIKDLENRSDDQLAGANKALENVIGTPSWRRKSYCEVLDKEWVTVRKNLSNNKSAEGQPLSNKMSPERQSLNQEFLKKFDQLDETLCELFDKDFDIPGTIREWATSEDDFMDTFSYLKHQPKQVGSKIRDNVRRFVGFVHVPQYQQEVEKAMDNWDEFAVGKVPPKGHDGRSYIDNMNKAGIKLPTNGEELPSNFTEWGLKSLKRRRE